MTAATRRVRHPYVLVIRKGGPLRFVVIVTNLSTGHAYRVSTMTKRGARLEAARLLAWQEEVT